MNKNAVVRVVGGESEPGVIGRGVRQGCPLLDPPRCFQYMQEAMMIETLEGNEEGGDGRGRELVPYVRFVDKSKRMISNSERGLQEIDGQG